MGLHRGWAGKENMGMGSVHMSDEGEGLEVMDVCKTPCCFLFVSLFFSVTAKVKNLLQSTHLQL